MSSKKARKDGKFVKYMKLPLKILSSVRDLYVHSLTGCAGQMAYGNAAMGCPAPHFSGLPRSFSTNSAVSRDDDLRELMRIASARSLAGKFQDGAERKGSSPLRAEPSTVPRSRTVVIGRIDEDKACEFGVNEVVVARSRSYAASRTRSGLV